VVVTSFGGSASVPLPLSFYTDAPGAFTAAAGAAPAPVLFPVVADWSAPMGLALAAGLASADAGAQAAALGPLLGLSPMQMRENQRQLAPMIYADTLSAQRSAALAAMGSVGEELSARRGGTARAGGQAVTTVQGTTFWMQGSGTMQRTTNGPANQPGHTVLGGGATVGVDAPVWPGLRLGVAVGVAHQVVRAGNGGQHKGEVGHLTGYGSYSFASPLGLGFVDAQASVIAAQGTASRTLGFYGVTAQGETGSLGVGGQVKGGVRVDFAGWQVEPSVGVSALRLHQGGLDESRAGVVGANIARGELTSLQALVGVRADRGFAVGEGMRLVGSVSATWAHEMGDERARVSGRLSGLPGAGFALMNAGGGRDALVASAQAVLETQSPLKLFVAYSNTTSTRTLGQAVTAGLRYSW
jgi:outer membrane autotransporter protein